MATRPASLALSLEPHHSYDRLQIRKLFEPALQGKLGGPWQSGIVQTPAGSGDYVFLVTLGGGRYDDVLYEDGYLRWKSQDQQRLDTPSIRRFAAHDAEQNNIYVFIRSATQRAYAYLGLLEYVDHDRVKENPCEFLWRVRSWNLSAQDLLTMGLPFESALLPTAATTPLHHNAVELIPTAPPKRAKRVGGELRDPQPRRPDDLDWARRDARNRTLGAWGEQLVLRHEIALLEKAGRSDLAARVEHVALVDSSAGYDIRSYDPEGSERLIEVKSTAGPKSAAFFISANEVRTSVLNPESYCIYRVFGLEADVATANFYVLRGEVANACDLTPSMYLAAPRRERNSDE